MSASRFVPGRRLALAAGAGLPFAFAGSAALLALASFDGALLALALWESRRLGAAPLTVERLPPSRVVVGEPATVRVLVHNPTASPLRVVVRDDVPSGFTVEPEELTFVLPPHARREGSYQLVAPQRGAFAFGDLHARMEGSLGLGARLRDVSARREVRVYPRISGALGRELSARIGVPRTLGARVARRRGGGREFEQLREYVQGDQLRDVDWKSSAKRQRPITRVMREERSQSVLLAIDLGRLMGVRSRSSEIGSSPLGDRTTKLDDAIDAALLLAWTALRHGDRVGLLLFADDVEAFLPPKAGPSQYRVILDALYDAKSAPVSTDARRFTEFVKLHLPQRSLVVLFSDLLDDTHATPLAEHLATLRAKHLPVCVSMEDANAEALARATPRDDDDVYRRAAAADVLSDRRAVKALLRRGRVELVESHASELAVHTVARYLDIKAKGAL